MLKLIFTQDFITHSKDPCPVPFKKYKGSFLYHIIVQRKTTFINQIWNKCFYIVVLVLLSKVFRIDLAYCIGGCHFFFKNRHTLQIALASEVSGWPPTYNAVKKIGKGRISAKGGRKKTKNFLVDMSTKLWPHPLSPFSGQKIKCRLFSPFFIHILVPIEPECSEMLISMCYSLAET